MNTKYLFVVLLIFAYSCNSKKDESSNKNDKNKPVSVDVLIAATQAISSNVEANGTIVPSESADIHPEMSGRITYLNTPDGLHVNAGTILAKINDADLQAQLAKSNAQLAIAVKSMERLKQLLAVSGVNQADYDVAVNTVNNINADIQLINAQIDKSIIKAPFNGVLGLRLVSAGAYVTPQNSIATIQNIDKVKVDFTLPETYISYVRKGTIVKVIGNENSIIATATVIATDGAINTTTRNIKVRAMLNGKAIAPGTFVKVILETGNDLNKIIIPTNAIIPDATSKKVIVVKNGKGKMVNVETGTRSAGGVAITNGLAVGDSVVVTGVLFVKPNAPVKVKSIKSLDDLMKTQ